LAWLLSGIVLLLFIASLVFYIYRDQIGRKVILKLNDIQKGEISFAELSFNPFIHFPNISVGLQNLYYTNSQQYDSIMEKDTIAFLAKLYVAIDVVDLIGGQINVSKITMTNGSIFLKRYPDSTLNLFLALGMVGESTFGAGSVPGPPTVENDTTIQKDPKDISLEGIVLKNISMKYVEIQSRSFQETTEVEIKDLKASMKYSERIIASKLQLAVELQSIPMIQNLELQGMPVQVKSTFLIDRNSGKITIEPSYLHIKDVSFQVEGAVYRSENSHIDLSLEGKDEDLSFFSGWFSETGLNNIRSGETYFSGKIQGPLNGALPDMKFDFGMRDVNLHVPGVNHDITDVNLEGFFQSGQKMDLSEAKIAINKFKGILPGGYLNAHLSVESFTIPRINLLWDMKADISGFDQIFNINGIRQIRGEIKLYDDFAGVFDPATHTLTEERNESILLLDSLSFNIPDVMLVKGLSGRLERSLDTLKLFNLRMMAGNSDLLINGRINNLLSLVKSEENEITAELAVKSDTFDLPVFFAFDPKVGRSFPYRIIDIDLELHATTSRNKLLEFNANPEIEFDILHLGATIENLFPPVNIQKGNMLMSEKEGQIYLAFDDFEIDIADANLNADVLYYSPSVDPDFVRVNVDISGLNPSGILLAEQDTIPGITNGILNGFIHTELEIGRDTMDYETFNVKTGNLDYITANDTFNITGLIIKALDIHYNNDGKTPFASLSAGIRLQAAEIRSNHFHVKDVYYDIDATGGSYTVYPEKIHFFGKEGEGVYKLTPFANESMYEFKYKVTDFRVENLLSSVMADTLLKGLMDLDLDVTSVGGPEQNIFSGINGYVELHGKDLVLYGIDLDNLITKFQRSQKFNLVDVGAVALLGPFGLALTKGSEFASLALGNFGDTTKIGKVISEWDCVNGRLIIKDVAFTTEENRIAGTGWIDLSTDSLDITIAVLDKNGCSILSQSVFGELEDPEQSDIKIVSTVLAPITNLIGGALGKDCEVFYDGQIAHPSKKKQK